MADMWKVMVFRKAGLCDFCGAALPVGVRGQWNPLTKKIRCLEHAANALPLVIGEELIEPPSYRSTAGRSAKEKYSQLHAVEEENIRKRYGRFKRLANAAVFLHDDSQKTANWKVGAVGEEVVGERIDLLAQELGFEVLHDRRRPPTKANIDHLVVTPVGVFVIDAKNYDGQIEVRHPGLFLGGPEQLFINGRNRTKIVDGVKKQVAQVESVLLNTEIQMPVFGVLTFVVGPLHLFIVQEKISGIFLSTQRGIEKILRQPGSHSVTNIKAITKLLALQFPEA